MNDSEAGRRVQEWLAGFEQALAGGDIAAAAGLFADACYWRDLVAFSWNIVTVEGRDGIAAMLAATLAEVRPGRWAIDGAASVADGVTEAWLTFETAVARGKGRLRLSGGKCLTLLTAMTELKGFEEKSGASRERGTRHGVFRGRETWLQRRTREEEELGFARQPFCLVVGGGQGGIALGARLKRLGVPALIIDRHERPGDAWRRRYDSLCLHDTVWYDHMPYLPFPDHWPIFTPKDQIGDWLESYTKIMELNYWSSSECKQARYDEDSGEWVVAVEREGTAITLRPKHLVLATGMSGMPEMPHYPGWETFAGEQHHSSRHRGGAGYAGKKCVVVGSNNSAHDICADLWEHDAEVTMIQRSSTLVMRSDTLLEMARDGVYSQNAADAGISTERADLTVASMPYRIMPETQAVTCRRIIERDAAFYDGLREAGFLLDFGDDNTGIGMKYLRRGSGYYIDVGASEMIMDGRIRLRSGVEVTEIRPQGVVLNDGSEVAADLIVYATGYGSMNGWAAKLISREVADRVGKCWGLGSGTTKDPGPWEGELRNMWKPTRQEALWFHGGNLAQSRHYSRYLALQLKARLEGIATPVFGMGEVHHTS